jgi:hypothetical protein
MTWTILSSCCEQWLETNKVSFLLLPSTVREKIPKELLPHIQAAFTAQQQIGWHFAIRFFLSKAWLIAQSIETHRNLTDIRQRWCCQVLMGVWHFYNSMWQHRNEILHSSESTGKTITESSTNAQVTAMYQRKHEFAVIDQRLFSLPLDLRLRSKFRSKQHRLKLAQRYYSTTRQRLIGSQYSVTHFFPKIRKPRRPPPEPPDPPEVSVRYCMRQLKLVCPPI